MSYFPPVFQIVVMAVTLVALWLADRILKQLQRHIEEMRRIWSDHDEPDDEAAS